MIEPVMPERVDPNELIDDDALIVRIHDDPQAFSALFRRYVSRVYRYLYGRLGCQADAEDLTAQVFIEVLRALPRYRPQGAFPAWLFCLVRRRAIDQQRKHRDLVSLDGFEDLPGPAGDPLAEVIHQEDLGRLAELYRSLDDDQQELIRLRFAAGLTYSQIGAVLGRSPASVGMALTRLLRRLNERWEAEDE
jgi:RNA polymerase sigma-70 factor (ECF subfamily)